MTAPSITVSVVSHGQNALVNRLMADIGQHCPAVELILTENIPDAVPLDPPARVQRLELIANELPKGFGANHNSAFARCSADAFFVVNPDVRLLADPFSPLAGKLGDGRVAAVGPVVRSASGQVEDSARRFPTVMSLLRKLVMGNSGPDYPTDKGLIEVEWVAGMFIGFDRAAYARVGGFDERYFLYYEDVDICRRLRTHGYKVLYDPTVSIIHEARRASRTDPRLMRIHAASVLRYLRSTLRDG